MATLRTEDAQERFTELVSRIVVPVQGSSDELLVQQWAIELAVALGAPIRAVHIATDGLEPPADVFEYMAQVAEDREVAMETAVLNARDVASELAEDLEPTDLAVIGTRTLGNHASLDSVTEALIREAPCPVQVINLE